MRPESPTDQSVAFSALGVSPQLTKVLADRGILTAFPIQAATIPEALEGRDVCGKAPTGSGKTLAFGLALVQRLSPGSKKTPRALILAPTRELASQIEREIAPLAETRGLKTLSIYGGTSYGPQRQRLSRGVDIVVACPGRLEDLIEQGSISLRTVEVVVVDEADRMADMGFLPAVRRILAKTPAERQTLLFSATLEGEVDKLISEFQKDPSKHDVSSGEDDGGNVTESFVRVRATDRNEVTAQLIEAHGPTIVFCRTKHGADRVAKQLEGHGIISAVIHGDRSQAQREKALRMFTQGRASALIATDVAARGIHVDDVACVVHYDPPADDKDYIHRSGRTGRAGNDGAVYTFVTDEKRKAVMRLQRDLGHDTSSINSRDLDLTQIEKVIITPPAKSSFRSVNEALDERAEERGNSRNGASRGGNGGGNGGGRGYSRGGNGSGARPERNERSGNRGFERDRNGAQGRKPRPAGAGERNANGAPRAERSDRPERSERSDRPERSDRSDRPAHASAPAGNRAERSDRSDRPGTSQANAAHRTKRRPGGVGNAAAPRRAAHTR